MDLSELEIPLLLSQKSQISEAEHQGFKEIDMKEATNHINDMIAAKLGKFQSLLDDPICINITKHEKSWVILSERQLILSDRLTGERKSKNLPMENPMFLDVIKTKNLAIVGDRKNSKVWVFSLADFELVKILDSHKTNVTGIFSSPDEKYLFMLKEDEEVIRWDLNNLGKFKDFSTEHYEKATVSYNSDLIAFTNRNNLAVYSIHNRDLIKEKAFDNIISQFKFAPSGDFIVIMMKQTIRLLNTDTLDILSDGFSDLSVTCFTISPVEDIIICGHNTGEISLLDFKNSRPQIKLSVHTTPVTSVFLSENSLEIFSIEKEEKRKMFYTQFPDFGL